MDVTSKNGIAGILQCLGFNETIFEKIKQIATGSLSSSGIGRELASKFIRIRILEQ